MDSSNILQQGYTAMDMLEMPIDLYEEIHELGREIALVWGFHIV
jgi:hypothetical protein